MGSDQFAAAMQQANLKGPPIHWELEEAGWVPEFTTPLGTARTAPRREKKLFEGEKKVVCMMFASFAAEYLFNERLYDVGIADGHFALIERKQFVEIDQEPPSDPVMEEVESNVFLPDQREDANG